MTETAKRYGGSLYELAKEEQLTDELLSELETAVTCFGENADYMRLLTAENLPKKERCDLLDEEGLLPELFGCVQAYRAQYNADHGIIEATVVSAVPLQDASREKLLAKLAALTGKTVTLKEKVDPSVLGGLRLDMDGKRLDGTVQRRLETMRDEIAGVVM